jgi:hypothetical protein
MKTGSFFSCLSFLSLVNYGYSYRSSAKRLLNPLTTPIEGLISSILAQTYVDFGLSPVTGEHSFIPPDFSAGDQRGPCPGLNALANHGYIARNGVTEVRRTSLRRVLPS